jgi:hypothetical protein
MDDHFWPSVYPGLIVGGLIGLADGSILSTLAGGLAGLGGAFAAFYAVNLVEVEPGIVSLAAVILGAAAAAKVAAMAVAKVSGRARVD